MPDTGLLIKIGKRIKEIRTKKTMTQNKLAAKCGFEKASMSKIESGRANPTLRTLIKISIALDVPLGELCND
jgi:transcriptional regulator with XRE-family HTH domain